MRLPLWPTSRRAEARREPRPGQQNRRNRHRLARDVVRVERVMGRLSAAIGRLIHPPAGQVQIYIDDVFLALRG